MTKHFANDKSLGFTVITNNRPFHLFSENQETRFLFLQAFSCINTIPVRPKISELEKFANSPQKREFLNRMNSAISTTDAETNAGNTTNDENYKIEEINIRNEIKPQQKRFVLRNSKQKIKIIPYKNGVSAHDVEAVAIAIIRNNRSKNSNYSSPTKQSPEKNRALSVSMRQESPYIAVEPNPTMQNFSDILNQSKIPQKSSEDSIQKFNEILNSKSKLDKSYQSAIKPTKNYHKYNKVINYTTAKKQNKPIENKEKNDNFDYFW